MINNSSLNSIYYNWWKNIDKTIFLLIIILFSLGLFFSLVSTSLIASDKLDTNNYFFFFKHLVYIFIGLLTLVFFSSLSEKNLFRFSIYLFFITLFFLFLVPIFGTEVKGSKRWLNLFFLPQFQPIELLKPFIIIFVATILCSEKNYNIYIKYLLTIISIIPTGLLLIMQPDIGQTLLVFLSWAILVFVSGINLLFILLFISLSIISLLYVVFFIPKFIYIKSRILSFFNPDGGTHNFQSDKAIEAISSGGFFGKGIGEGTLKTRVPEAHTDYIVSVISEEFGVIAIIFLLILFLFFIYSVFKKIYLEKSEKNKLVLTGAISLIIFQALIHLGVNIRLFPTTGMTLPFLSYGGSSIIGVSILSGIILNLTKRKIN
ncbi:FtsW/RodA/SpoVE family cell cycle protein [Candidatus Pelagibacter ubique]|jgi:cell division protein FtsW|uniref:FtsW/RodA/SpoVE family cell cycle protein n=1 Tax=Pelagibacter ubique TaxID=198252 RepID=UPI00231CD95A|nr:FtsW/RodA/SpoVE family cell cycle protein [Candidatus Pelagibacter ubique]MBL6862554.1 FtsW/RodA/SpoVE family cell cycle protein [Candidatus Pelagibacter bacterium]MDA7457344.1 FtsW/RodA/SpoVE family cell cycle protein [Candidatus Pelagibacter ubique]MDA9972463.1 FtsW/RodA/SpoVE family cell cycle protein [Candidatus Pelagibacter ubique]MDC3410497.1 FtsW/RodA/SpoVE family cell cycle protein [Candidatus Pelagibacter ubique]MDO7549214.1 FtsW/RodA/SpoVE family cell cycle protein [Candidatus Pel